MCFMVLQLLVSGLVLPSDPPIIVQLGGPREIRGEITSVDDYVVTVTFRPVKAFDAATNEEVNSDLGREYALRALAQHVSQDQDVRFEISREVVKESRIEGDRFRVTIQWPKASVRILAAKEERKGGRLISPTALKGKFFTAKQDCLDTLAALAARNANAIQGARTKAQAATAADRRRVLARTITDVEDRGNAAFETLTESVRADSKLLDLTERPEVLQAIVTAKNQFIRDLQTALETPLALVQLPFRDVKIDPPFDDYLVTNPLVMELAGGIQVDLGDGKKVLIGVAKTVLEIDSAAERLRAEKVCTVKARAAAIGERDGTTVSYLKLVKDKVVLEKDAKGESATTASERLTIFREEVKGKVKNLPVVGRWRSEDGKTFYLAVGGPLGEK